MSSLDNQVIIISMDKVGVRKIRWNVVPAENSQGTTRWKETADSSNKDWKADGWGAKSDNRSSQRNNPGRPPRRPDERGPPPPRQRFELTIEEKTILLEVDHLQKFHI